MITILFYVLILIVGSISSFLSAMFFVEKKNSLSKCLLGFSFSLLLYVFLGFLGSFLLDRNITLGGITAFLLFVDIFYFAAIFFWYYLLGNLCKKILIPHKIFNILLLFYIFFAEGSGIFLLFASSNFHILPLHLSFIKIFLLIINLLFSFFICAIAIYYIFYSLSKIGARAHNFYAFSLSIVILSFQLWVAEFDYILVSEGIKTKEQLFIFSPLAFIFFVFSVYAIWYFLTKKPFYMGVTSSSHDFYKKYNLTPREFEVIELLIQGYSNGQIAETLFISESTTKQHIHSIFQKTGVKRRYELLSKIK